MALDLGTLSATIDVKDGGFAKKISKAKTDLEALKKSLDTVEKVSLDLGVTGEDKLKDAASSAKSLNTALGKVNKKVDVTPTGSEKLEKASKAAEDLGKDLDEVSKKKPKISPEGTGKLTEATRSAKQLSSELDSAGKKKPNIAPTGTGQLDKAAGSAKALGSSLSGAAGAGRGLSVSSQPATELDRAAGAGGRLKGALDSLGNVGALIGVGAAAGGVSAGLGAALRIGNDFTNELNTLSAVSGATADQMSQVSEKARQLGNDIDLPNTSASDAAAAMTELAKGGFSVDQSMTAAKGSLQLAAAAGTDAATAATIQSQALQSFGLGADYAAKMSDVLANAANASSAEISDIAAGLQQSGAVANQFGLSVEDTAASLGLLANAGIQGSDAGTLLKSTLLALTDQSAPAQGAIEELGLTVYDANGKFVGMSSLMGQLKDASKGMSDEQYQAATATLFGSDAMRLAGVAAEVGGEGFDKMRTAVDKQGAAADVAAAKTKGLPGAIAQVGNAAEEVGLTLYDRFQGPLTTALESAAGGITKLGSAMSAIPGPAFAGILALVASKFLDVNGKMGTATGGMRTFGSAVRENQAHFSSMGREIGTMSSAIVVLGERSQTIGRMNTAFLSAGSGMRQAGANAKLAASETTGLARMMLSAKGTAQSFGGTLTGVANGGMSLLKSGASGLVGALGGPWGLAIGAATTAVGILAQKHQEAAQREEEHKQKQDELRGTLDETTGAITEQTTALQLKKLEESGARETATELGIAQQTLADATTGNADAMQQVNNAIDAGMEKASQSNTLWQKSSESFTQLGISYADIANASQGVAGAQEKIHDAIRNSDLGLSDQQALLDMSSSIQHSMGDTEESAAKLRGEVGGLNDDFQEVAGSQAAAALTNFKNEADQAADVASVLGDKVRTLGDTPEQLSVKMDAGEAQTVKAQLDEIGVKADYLEETGTLNVEMPNGNAVLSTLAQIKGDVATFPDGSIDIKSNTPEVQQQLFDMKLAIKDPVTGEIRMKDDIQKKLTDMAKLKQTASIDGKLWINTNAETIKNSLNQVGIKTQTLPTGNVRILDNTPENKRHLDELGIKTVTLPDGRVAITDTSASNMAALDQLGIKTTTMPGGFVEITDTSAENMAKLNSLGVKTTTLPNGKVVISDNSDSTKSNILNNLSNGAVDTTSSHTVSIIRKITDIFTKANGGFFADGGVNFFADGHEKWKPTPGSGAEDHTAQIAKGGAWRVWAEPETEGEAYIPLARRKRGRSTQILSQVAGEFGLALIDHAGNAVGGDVDPAMGNGSQRFADGGIRSNAQLKAFVNGQSVAGEKANRPLTGAPYTNTPAMGEWGDCSSTQSAIASFMVGQDPFPRKFATGSEGSVLQQLGFTMGNGPDGTYRIGWLNGGPGGGHTSGTLPDGTNVEMGGGNGGGMVGGSAAPWNDGLFTDHAWIRPLEIPVGNAGLDSYDSLGGTSYGVAGGLSSSGSSSDGSTTKKLNGDNGALFRDGSVLELAAAAYSRQTGTPMPDDVVSWGQVMGLYTEVESDGSSGKDAEKNAKKREKASSDLDAAKGDLKLAEQDLDVKKMKRDEANNNPKASAATKAAAQLAVDKAQKRVDELNQKIEDLQNQIDAMDSAAADQLDAYGGLDGNLPGTSGNKVADAFVRSGRKRGITDRGIEIALAAGLVESGLKVFANPAVPESMNFPHDAVGGDADSIGPLQQRGNGAWGTVADRMDPEKSSGMFYDVLDDEDYNRGDAGAHAQRVQRSAFPDRYAQKMAEAAEILSRYGATDGKESNPVAVTAMADGGILGSARSAQINEGSATLWAEAGPEAYIPLSSNKRARSIDIWAETGKRLGIDAVSMLQLMGSGVPALLEGDLTGFSTGGSISMDRFGLNTDAAAWRASRGVQPVVGAVFNGPVQVNDPRRWVQGQVNNAGKMLGNAMKGVML